MKQTMQPMSEVRTDSAADSRFVRFITRHHVMTVAVTDDDGMPYCAALFYAYDPSRGRFVFTTDLDTRHGGLMARHGFAAASIVLETRTVGKVQGLQIRGRVRRADGDEGREARRVYVAAFPYAAVAGLSLWIMEPTFMKLTDNRLGFGTKLVWNE